MRPDGGERRPAPLLWALAAAASFVGAGASLSTRGSGQLKLSTELTPDGQVVSGASVEEPRAPAAEHLQLIIEEEEPLDAYLAEAEQLGRAEEEEDDAEAGEETQGEEPEQEESRGEAEDDKAEPPLAREADEAAGGVGEKKRIPKQHLVSEAEWEEWKKMMAHRRKLRNRKHKAGTTIFRQHVHGSTPTGFVELGTPPIKIAVILDTGSDKCVIKTWESLQKELQMVDANIDKYVTPTDGIYNHNRSTSYLTGWSERYGHRVPRRGFIAYGSGVAMTHEGYDTLRAGGHQLHHYPISEITADSLKVLHSKKGAAGILGLQHMKNKSLGSSVFSELRKHSMMTAFGYCRNAPKNKGLFIWGDPTREGLSLPVIGQMHWAVSLAWVSTSRSQMPSTASMNQTVNQTASQTVNQTVSQTVNQTVSQTVNGTVNATVNGTQSGSNYSRTTWGGSLAKKDTDRTELTHSIPGGRSMDRRGAAMDEQGLASSEDSGFVDQYARVKYAMDPAGASFLAGGGRPQHGPAAETADQEWKEVEKVIEKLLPPPEEELMPLPLCSGEASVGTAGNCVAIIDSGSNIIAGPAKAVKAITRRLGVKYDCSNMDELPALHFELGGQRLSIPPQAYIMKVKLPSWAAGGPGKPAGLAAESEALEENPWAAAFQEFRENRGFDIGSALGDTPLEDLKRFRTLCLPAFVPLDARTQMGALWVIGTPLFDKYYTRWSWDLKDESPKIFVKEVQEVEACRRMDETSVYWSPPSAHVRDVSGKMAADASEVQSRRGGGRLMRSEQPRAVSDASAVSNSAAEAASADRDIGAEEEEEDVGRDLDDIMYPHWAKDVQHV